MKFQTLLILLSTFIGNNLSLDFVPQDQNTGLTFVKLAKAKISYDSYTIVYHLDISQYLNLTVMIERFISFGWRECTRLKSETCNDLLTRVTTQLADTVCI